MSLALEAERLLKNIYISKKEIKEKLKTDGHYVPPTILFRFHGYIECKIRNKPLNQKCLEEPGKSISLFDLYFKYNTPLHLVHDVFYDFMLVDRHRH